ncbi:MAG: sialate O-acetylesterase [Pirellulales bacterium]
MIRGSSVVRSIAALLAAAVFFSGSASLAAVKPHNLFTPGAVLQRGREVPVWGTAAEGEKVTVRFQGQELSTEAKDGRWRVTLQPLEAGGPFDLVISGENTVEIKDVLVGEVWIASGQSNMQWAVSQSAEPEQTIAESANPMIRLFTVPRRATAEPQTEVEAAWAQCGPETVPGFSAVAYAFGRDLQKHLNVPVGLISTNYGGTPAEAWTSRAKLDGHPDLKCAFGSQPATDHPSSPAGLYNAMIHPLLPYAIQGAIWYQGESNASRAWQYRTLFPAMIQDWRTAWGQGDFTFLTVQLAPFTAIVDEPGESDWAELREAQLLSTQVLVNAGMVVITDLGAEQDIHPKQKAPVGARLALAARALAYGEPIEHSGPVYSGMEIKGDRVVLSFTHLGGGLVAKDGPLAGFTVAGKDRKFVKAYAEIDGGHIVVHSPQVPQPVAVRFGWANYPVVNLWNAAGLPAIPFRTDVFPGKTQPPY